MRIVHIDDVLVANVNAVIMLAMRKLTICTILTI
jgi:hypothetical protein